MTSFPLTLVDVITGALGRVLGRTLAEARELRLVPAALVAVIVKAYEEPLRSPAMRQLVVLPGT